MKIVILKCKKANKCPKLQGIYETHTAFDGWKLGKKICGKCDIKE